MKIASRHLLSRERHDGNAARCAQAWSESSSRWRSSGNRRSVKRRTDRSTPSLLVWPGTLAAAQKLCLQLGFEVAQVLVIIELIGLGGREKLANVDHFISLLRYSEAELEAIAAQHADRSHQPKDAWKVSLDMRITFSRSLSVSFKHCSEVYFHKKSSSQYTSS